MKIYDITQEVFSSAVFAGDTPPTYKAVKRIENGDICNLTDLSMCVHNGTHIDAPFHFFSDGKAVEQIPLEKTVGVCYVAEFNGELSEKDARRILDTARRSGAGSEKRILLKGNAIVSAEAAKAFAENNIDLIGVESQTVGHIESPLEVHRILLGRETVLLEGVRLSNVNTGVYFLSCTPLALGGLDGSPCRAILIEDYK